MHDKRLLTETIQRYVRLQPEEEEKVLDAAITRHFKRGQYIDQEGRVNHYTNLICSGSARVFYVDAAGQEHVIQLGIRGWWISDYSSFIMQRPGRLYTEALEPTETISLHYDSLQKLFDDIPMMERFYRLLIQRAYASFQNRVLQNLSQDAETRYRAFRESYPEMDQQISQKHIASYLGISAEFLSKVKKRIVETERENRRRP